MESETHSAEEDFIGVSDVTIECNSPQNVIYITEFILTSQKSLATGVSFCKNPPINNELIFLPHDSWSSQIHSKRPDLTPNPGLFPVFLVDWQYHLPRHSSQKCGSHPWFCCFINLSHPIHQSVQLTLSLKYIPSPSISLSPLLSPSSRLP